MVLIVAKVFHSVMSAWSLEKMEYCNLTYSYLTTDNKYMLRHGLH
jgi:hypothetical protein